MNSKIPFMCCGKWLPTSLLEYCIFPTRAIASYTDLLIELGADCPLYCSNRKCGHFLASQTTLKQGGLDNMTCNHCNRRTCVHCRKRGHAGICVDDPVHELLSKVLGKGNAKYCRKCHQLVEKNGGCNHMTCRCGHQWCWRCGSDYKACGCPLF